MDKLTKQGYFIAYIKEILVEDIVSIYIRQRSKIYNSILKSILSRIRSPRSNINGILFIDRQINKKTKLDIKTVFKIVY